MIVGVVGLGYVGLPLAIALGKKHKTFGFDLSSTKITSYRQSIDPTNEVNKSEFEKSKHLTFHDEPSILSEADIIIIAVPTPVNESNIPDLSALESSSSIVGKHMKKDSIVIYESTVFPGATEEICIPILETSSQMKWKKDFFVGYSPERINPGDKERTIEKIIKVVSGDTKETLSAISNLYASIISAGVYEAKSIKVAEAAKVIENTQRDLNIALVNELSVIFNKLDISTSDVLKEANTKWNFLDFKPGLVGGHCIGVDPYYLTYKAKEIGYNPEVILAGRKINDSMTKYVAQNILDEIKSANRVLDETTVTILGLTFKENCSDLRNSKVIELVEYLKKTGLNLHIHDPYSSKIEVESLLDLPLANWEELPKADILVYAVPHKFYEKNHKSFISITREDSYIVDLKSSLDKDFFLQKKRKVWSL